MNQPEITTEVAEAVIAFLKASDATTLDEAYESLRAHVARIEGEQVWRVEFWHDTTMWNEGFSLADTPWIVMFTDDEQYAKSIPSSVRGSGRFMEFDTNARRVTMPTIEEIRAQYELDRYEDRDDPVMNLVGVDRITARAQVDARVAEFQL